MSVYNARLYTYVDGLQLRLYNRPIVVSHKVPSVRINDTDEYLDEEQQSLNRSDVRTDRSDEKIAHSLHSSKSRTVQEMYEITRANKWSYFVTFTLDPKMIDRTDYDLIATKVSKWLNNLKSRYAPDLKYILVPELHQDGKSFHFHALISDIGNIEIKFSGKVVYKCKSYNYKDKPNCPKIYNLPNWKFGWSTATLVSNNARVASYITKYITKDLCAVTKGRKRYWTSRNVNRADIKNLDIPYEDMQKIIDDNMTAIGHMSSKQIPDAGQEIVYIEFNEKEIKI